MHLMRSSRLKAKDLCTRRYQELEQEFRTGLHAEASRYREVGWRFKVLMLAAKHSCFSCKQRLRIAMQAT
jgi:hypothetical protein